MTSFEEKLRSKIGGSRDVPDADAFVARLHNEIDRRAKMRRALTHSVSLLIIVSAVTLGLYRNLTVNGEDDYWTTIDYRLLTDVDEGTLSDSLYADDSFVFAAVQYLIQESDLAGDGWEILEDLDELGIIDLETTLDWEEQS